MKDLFALDQNYPNPFNPATRIRYSLPEPGEVSLRLLSILGEELATLVEGVREAGSHVVTFDGAGLPSGIYLCRLQAGPLTAGRRLVLLR